jgi:hypothetical protein
MDQARNVTASFQSVFSLTVTKNGPGTGTVTSLSPNLGINCGSTCQAGFQEGVSVTLHAAPDASASFSGWSSGDPGFNCPGTGDCTVTMDQARTVTAMFGANVTLTVTKSGTGTGTVTSLSPNLGINCGSTCQASFPQGTAVTLHAAPDASVTFAGWSGGGCSGTADCVVTLNSAQSVNAQFTAAGGPGCTGTITENATCVAYNGWSGVTDANASGGAYRTSSTKSDKATWKSPVATSVVWRTYMGPDQGKAKVTIDGAAQTFDMYAASPTWTTKTFSGLPNKAHTVIVTALGTKRTAATGTNVRLDALTAGATTVQESDGSIQYDTWKTVANAKAADGAFRSSTASTAVVTVTFTGTEIDWITEMGTSYGIAKVFIDGVQQGSPVDLYQTTAAWKVSKAYGSLTPGQHTLTIQVTGQKNASSTAAKVPVDGFVIHT